MDFLLSHEITCAFITDAVNKMFKSRPNMKTTNLWNIPGITASCKIAHVLITDFSVE